MIGAGRVQFTTAVMMLDRFPAGDDQDVARWVASALYGIATGDALAPRSADAMLGATAELVLELASGKWREEIARIRAERAQAGDGAAEPRTWLIACLEHGRRTEALWWRPDGNGYTTRIEEAGRYTEADARRIARNRESDVPVRVEDAEAKARRVVYIDDLPDLARARHERWDRLPGAEATS